MKNLKYRIIFIPAFVKLRPLKPGLIQLCKKIIKHAPHVHPNLVWIGVIASYYQLDFLRYSHQTLVPIHNWSALKNCV